MTTLTHYSKKPFTGPVKGKRQNAGAACERFKPRGLWFSVDQADSYGWKQWCESEGYCLDSLDYQAAIALHEQANILRIETGDALCELADRFGRPDKDDMDYDQMDWVRIAAAYQGIIIAPYQWGCRLSPSWYWMWDCASGCVWNPKAIAEVRP